MKSKKKKNSSGKKLIKKISQLQRRLEVSQESKRNISKELVKQTRTNSQLTKKWERARIRIGAAKQNNQTLEQKVDHLRQIIQQQADLLNQQDQELSEKNEKLTKKTTYINRKLQRIIDLKKEQGNLQAVQAVLTRILVEENHANQQTQADLNKINIDLRETEENWAGTLDDWQQSQEVNGLLARWLVKTNEELNNERTKKQQAERERDARPTQQQLTDEQNAHQQAETERDNWKRKAEQVQNQLNNHQCLTCSHSDYDTIQQERDNWKKKSEEHVCPRVDNSELENLRQEVKDKDKKLTEKDQKIAELEKEIRELKNKPPIQPTNTENNSELNNLLTERTKLLATIQEKETVIRELEVKLQEQPKEVIKEVENGEVIRGLKAELSKEQQSVMRLRYYSWLVSGICIMLLVGLVKLLRKRRLRKR